MCGRYALYGPVSRKNRSRPEFWDGEIDFGARMINARAESVAEKPAFRSAFRRHRCLVPMSGFYEWKKEGARKVPYFVRLLNAEIFAAAGLHESWPGKDGAEPIESFTIITTEANDLVRTLYDRMPAIVPEERYEAWLDPDNDGKQALHDMLEPYPAEEMRAYPISLKVNNVKNDGPELIEPAHA